MEKEDSEVETNLPSEPASEGLSRLRLLIVLSAFILFFLALYAMHYFSESETIGRSADAISECSRNMTRIGEAILAYCEENGEFPPAFTVDESGNRLHSWRALILPYLGEKEVFDLIDFSTPWDSQTNQRARDTAVQVYRCPWGSNGSTYTHYSVVVGPGGLFTGSDPSKPEQISDDPETTIMLIESKTKQSVPWMQPTDLSVDQLRETDTAGGDGIHIAGFRMITYLSGETFHVSDWALEEFAEAWTTVSGGEPGDW